MTRMRTWGCRILKDLTICGYRAVILENAKLRICVLTEKGSDILELLYKPRDINLLASSPNGLRCRGEIASSAHPLGNFFDNYEGGWQEIFPSAGPPCEFRGAQFGQHGEVALLPWSMEVLQDDAEQLAVLLRVRCLRTPLLVEKTLRLRKDESTLQVEERILNLSPLALDLMWGHHPAYGYPLIDQGAKIVVPPCDIVVPESETFSDQRLLPGFRGCWPIAKGKQGEIVDLAQIPGPQTGTADFCFLSSLREARYRIENEKQKVAVQVEWELKIMPYLWYWQVCNGGTDWPWWGRLYCQALEPFSAPIWGLDKAVEQGLSLKIRGQESRSFFLTLTVENL